MLLPSSRQPPQAHVGLTSRAYSVTSAAVKPSAINAQAGHAASPQEAKGQQQQEQQWVSNEHLWRQSIQHKHAQRRRQQQLQQLEQLPELSMQGSIPGTIGSGVLGEQQQRQQQQNSHKAAGQVCAAVAHPAEDVVFCEADAENEVNPTKELTKAICTAGDAGQLLMLLLSAQQQCDSIHVSAAVNQCARGLVLDLQAPAILQQQEALQQEGLGQLQWLTSLDHATMVQQSQLWLSQQLQADTQQQQQQQQLEQGVASLSADWLLLLVLSHITQQHASTMVSQQLCTCLNSFAQLLQQRTHIPLLLVQPLKAACQQLLLSAHARLQQMDARGLSLVLHGAAGMACSRGGFSPNAGFMLSWYRASREKMQDYNSLDFAMMVGALGRMQMYPPAEWMADFWAASKAALPTFPMHELLLMLLGVAGTRRTPPPGWLPAAAQAMQPHLAEMSPAQLSTAVMAWAKLGHVPSTAWLKGFWKAWEARQLGFTARSHASVMWGIGTLRPIKPDQSLWAKKLQDALQRAVAQAATAVAAVALQKIRIAAQKEKLIQQEQLEQQQQQGLPEQQQLDMTAAVQSEPAAAVTQQQPDEQQQYWLDSQQELGGVDFDEQLELLAAQEQGTVQEQPQLLGSASLLHPTDCAMVIYGLARLGPKCLDPSFPAFWLAQSRSQLVNMNSQELATCVWALGKLRLLAPEAWLQQHLQCTARLASGMTHQQLAMVWWGCARLRYLPHVSVTAELLMCAAEQLPRFTPHSLSLMLWSLGALRMRPNKEWMQLVLTQVHSKLMNFDGHDLCGVLVGLYALGYHPGAAWLDTYMATLATKIHIVSPKQHERIMSVLKGYGYNAQDKGFAWVMDPVAVAAMSGRTLDRGSSSSHAAQGQRAAG